MGDMSSVLRDYDSFREGANTGAGEAMAEKSHSFVRRYTSLSSALDTLHRRKLVLLTPASWDDTNDSHLMDLYREQSGAGTILALCCTMASETYHHWKVFTPGMEGICLEFRRQPLEAGLRPQVGVRAEAVDYLRVRDLEALRPHEVDRLPFIKRQGFADEREWRIVAKTDEKAIMNLELDVSLTWINRIIINPWMPAALSDNLRTIIRQMPDCERIRIESSQLTNSARWKAAARKLCTVC